jgi:methionyl-tRNA formyltransferase
MKVVFMGTPEFAVPVLRVLLEDGYQVIAVVTQPDRPKGRKRTLTPSPVKVEAELRGIPVLQPERLRLPEAAAQVIALQPDLIVTAAFGQLLPKSILELPAHGCLNIHGSLLPEYRGGAPIQRAIMAGKTVTGVTLMYMAEGMDSGDMISKVEVPITDEDNSGTIFHKLSVAGAQLLRDTLPELLAGRTQAIPQDQDKVTFAPNLKREDEQIDWHRSALEIFHQIRGLNPMPGAFTIWNGENFKIWASRKPASTLLSKDAKEDIQVFAISSSDGVPGTVQQISSNGIEVTTGNGSLWLTEVQPAGKKAMSAAEFSRGSALTRGTIFGGL